MASDIVFDNAVVVSHDSYRKGYSSKLNDLSIRDYKTGGFNDKIICIDLDRYERSEFPQLLNNTMDAAIGISNLHNNRRVSKRLLLVELRLGYKSDRTLSGTELSDGLRDVSWQKVRRGEADFLPAGGCVCASYV